MEENKRSVLGQFFKQLDHSEQEIIKNYLTEKSLESLSKSFDSVIEGHTDETQAS